jgi:cytochrome c peroxidase
MLLARRHVLLVLFSIFTLLHAFRALSQELSGEPVTPIPLTVDVDPAKVELGKLLFSDVNLSSDKTVSCATCHHLNNYGMDGLPVSIGVKGRQGERNSPTVFNSGFLFKQFWDGRADTLEQQVEGPIMTPFEMEMSWPNVLAYLKANQHYATLFRLTYESEISKRTVSHAIAEFERSLITPNSPFDRYLRGDTDAISSQQKAGYQLFKSYGCVSCHQGMNLGGNVFEKLGIFRPYYGEHRAPTDSDLGRYRLTGEDDDLYEFKVPSLRNVAKTAPYFHDGSIATLKEAVQIMAFYQLGEQLADKDINDIVAFLESLTGVYSE